MVIILIHSCLYYEDSESQFYTVLGNHSQGSGGSEGI